MRRPGVALALALAFTVAGCCPFASGQDSLPAGSGVQPLIARAAAHRLVLMPEAASQPSMGSDSGWSPEQASTAPVAPAANGPAAKPAQRPFLVRYSLNGDRIRPKDPLGSVYIPVDSWVYPAMLRLYSLGYVSTAYIALRPWTQRSLLHILDESESDIRFDGNEEAVELLDKLYYFLRDEPAADGPRNRGLVYGVQSAYVGARVVGGTVLRDSWHLGQTFWNDYGRPYSNGFNSYNGFSTVAELGRFSLYVRGEYQHAPTYEGYSYELASKISLIDRIPYGGTNLFGGVHRPQATIPEGPVPSANNFRLLEANLSAHLLDHEVSFGKSDAWLGPGLGGSMAWSNNAENMYTFRINRVEPLRIPILSRLIGDVRYDFFIGSLKGHTFPRAPWAHSEILALAPSQNFQISFQRTIIFGGKGHSPVTLHTFLKGFFETQNVPYDVKMSRDDPGARFSSVTFSYRLPFLRRYATLYADSTTHDDVFPISAPRRAGWRPGIYLPRLPFVSRMDLRVEAAYTDYVTSRSTSGVGNYYEGLQPQGYTNKGFIMGDWIGREGKGGQAWLTYHLSGNESIAVQYMRKKNAKDFIFDTLTPPFPEYGTTQNVVRVDLVKRLGKDVELTAWFQKELWKAPLWKPGQQGSTTGAFQFTWFPGLKTTAR